VPAERAGCDLESAEPSSRLPEQDQALLRVQVARAQRERAAYRPRVVSMSPPSAAIAAKPRIEPLLAISPAASSGTGDVRVPTCADAFSGVCAPSGPGMRH
jgi:hypothetical protein